MNNFIKLTFIFLLLSLFLSKIHVNNYKENNESLLKINNLVIDYKTINDKPYILTYSDFRKYENDIMYLDSILNLDTVYMYKFISSCEESYILNKLKDRSDLTLNSNVLNIKPIQK